MLEVIKTIFDMFTMTLGTLTLLAIVVGYILYKDQ